MLSPGASHQTQTRHLYAWGVAATAAVSGRWASSPLHGGHRFRPKPTLSGEAVGPGDPHEREHRGELAESGPGQVLGQVVGGLRDQHDHGQVIEELKRADHALTRLLAVRAGRLPQGTAQPSPELCAGRTLA